MERRPTVRSLAFDIIPFSKRIKLESDTDCDLTLDVACPINMEEEDYDTYIEEIPGVTRLGIKRSCPDATLSAPSKIQAIAQRCPTNNDRLPLTQESGFSATVQSITSALNCEGDMYGMKREKKMMDLVKVTDRETPSDLYKSLHEEISSQKLQFKNNFNSMKETLAEKEGQIMRLEREMTDLKHSMLQHHIEKEALVMRHERELEDVKVSLRELNREKDGQIMKHKREIEDLKDSTVELNAEREGLIKMHNRVIEDLKTSFSMEKARAEDRHRQQMATYRSEILTVVLRQTTQNQEGQSSAKQSGSLSKASERLTRLPVADGDGTDTSSKGNIENGGFHR